MPEWIYNNKIFTSNDIDNNFGFIYLITNLVNGRKYIGKKVFQFNLKLKPLKGKKRKRKVQKESDWQDYYGSCPELKNDLIEQGYDKCTREIIKLCKDKRDLTYQETKLQFQYDVLEALDSNGNRLYYNDNILGKFFVKLNK